VRERRAGRPHQQCAERREVLLPAESAKSRVALGLDVGRALATAARLGRPARPRLTRLQGPHWPDLLSSNRSRARDANSCKEGSCSFLDLRFSRCWKSPPIAISSEREPSRSEGTEETASEKPDHGTLTSTDSCTSAIADPSPRIAWTSGRYPPRMRENRSLFPLLHGWGQAQTGKHPELAAVAVAPGETPHA
jgi:hypothetical protein